MHEFAKFLLASALSAVGAEVIDFGINRDPEDIVKAVIETDADAVVITTHNGVARSFGRHAGQRAAARAGRARCRSSWAASSTRTSTARRSRSTSAPISTLSASAHADTIELPH